LLAMRGHLDCFWMLGLDCRLNLSQRSTIWRLNYISEVALFSRNCSCIVTRSTLASPPSYRGYS
jgi:hypothetical protein